MNRHHLEILKLIKKTSTVSRGSKQGGRYHGTKSSFYNLRADEKKQIAKKFKEGNEEISKIDFIKLINSLNEGTSYEEKTMVGVLISLYSDLRRQLDPKLYNRWLENLEGWAEIDSYCQSAYSAKEMDVNWKVWKKMLEDFSVSDDVRKKRASLVFLTRSVRESTDIKFVKLALENTDRLKNEKNILVTKAISWILREMVKYYKDTVEKYIKTNRNSLPKVAVRETTRKIKTGKK